MTATIEDAKRLTRERLVKFINQNREFFGGIIEEADDALWTPQFFFNRMATSKEPFGYMVQWDITFADASTVPKEGLEAASSTKYGRRWMPIVTPEGNIIDGHESQSQLAQFYIRRGIIDHKPHASLLEHFVALRQQYDQCRAIETRSHGVAPHSVGQIGQWYISYFDATRKKFWTWDEIKEITSRELQRRIEYRKSLERDQSYIGYGGM